MLPNLLRNTYDALHEECLIRGVDMGGPKEEGAGLEEVGSDGRGTGLEAEFPDLGEGSINSPFDPAKIDVVTQGRTVDLLLTRLEEGEIDLSPEFQRRANLWNDQRKSGLIESLLLRIPIPSLYVSEDINGNYTVVDGLQRMCAIAHFAKVSALNAAVKTSLPPLRLSGLQSLPVEYKGKSFDELPRPLKRRISETELTLHVIRASTPAAVKFSIFSRINQGGLPLAPQEIRNAVYAGEWRGYVKAMAESVDFQKATDGRIRGERMEDVELVLRFVAHAVNRGKDRPENQNLDDFLNDFVGSQSLSWGRGDWDFITMEFYRSLHFSRMIFGEHAFRKYYGDGRRRPINRGLFESQTVVLTYFTEDNLKVLVARRNLVMEKLANQFEAGGEFSSSLLYATGRGSSSNTRLKILSSLLTEVLLDH
ncbi:MULTISPECIES: DUF262 domain-containing protein [Stenotrophomonas]|uniref:DUF262 domain-containing protein n=1 Tax=Stenotrophomonas TaxID=40323 RepID=UPI001C65939E|nr:DUF262 domain-containing protein [Stenotrophomonas maltophilia]